MKDNPVPRTQEDLVPAGSSMLDVVGRTPVVRLSKVVLDGAADVVVKLEWGNPTGSYQDRMALSMIEEAERRGDLRPGMTVAETPAAVRAPPWRTSAR